MWILLILVILVLFNDSIYVTRMIITSKKIKNSIKFAVISDFHCTNEKKILKHLQQINPDGILIPGDLIDENWSLNSVERLLEGIKQWPSYFVSGNHEFKKGRTYKTFSQMEDLLEKYQIELLDHRSVLVELKGETIWLGGIKDHCSDRTKNPDELDQKHINNVCSKCTPNYFTILMMHRPEQFRFVEEHAIDFLVSGHAHGGQWRLPGINGLYAPQQGLFPKRAGGVYEMKHGLHLVSRGLAHYWFLPRLLNHREINVIEIKRAD